MGSSSRTWIRVLTTKLYTIPSLHLETEEAARNAIDKVNGMLLNGKKVYVGKFIPRKERQIQLGDKARQYTNVYIKHIADEIDDEQLGVIFEAYGVITSAK